MAAKGNTTKKALAFVWVAVAVAALLLKDASAVRTAPVETNDARQAEAEREYQLVQSKLLELEQDPEALFHNFVREHNKKYEDETERAYRLGVFKDNLLRAKELNAKRQAVSDAVFGVTVFSDISETEFRTKMLLERLGNNYPTPQDKNDNVVDLELNVNLEDVPDEWDWRQHGAVTRVKNQGAVGTCWAFSAAANIEGQYALSQGGSLIDLSVEQIVDCDATSFPQNNSGDCGPGGGIPAFAFDYVLRSGGLEPWTDYPYCIGDGSCSPCPPPGYNTTICGFPQPCEHKYDCANKLDPSKIVASIDSWAWLAPDKNETLLKALLYQNGPASIAMDASKLHLYTSGIITSSMCSSDPLAADHAILLAGYGKEKVHFWLKETEYWEVKNSWGESWGEKGYFRLARNTNTCGVANFATTSLITH